MNVYDVHLLRIGKDFVGYQNLEMKRVGERFERMSISLTVGPTVRLTLPLSH